MCWVSFYESDDFQGGSITYTGPVSVPHLGGVDLSNGKSVGDEIDSLKLGPNSWLEVYKDGGYENRVRRFNPNTIVRNLDDYDIGDTISSFKLFSSEPANWPGPSTPSASNGTVIIDLLNDEIIDRFGDLVAGLVTLIPRVGGALKGLVQFLWPDMTNPKEVWYEIKGEVIQIVQNLIDQQKTVEMEKRLDGLGNLLLDYINTSYNTPQKGQMFTHILGTLNEDEPYFFDQSSPQLTLTYFVNLGTIEIAALNEQYTSYSEIYTTDPNNPVTDPDRDYHLQILKTKIQKYCEGAQTARAGAMEWRLSLIETKKDGKKYYTYDSYNKWKGSPKDDEYYADIETEERKQQVQNEYGAVLDILLYPSIIWRYFNPEVTEKPELKPIFTQSGPFGGDNGTAFKDNPCGPITNVNIQYGSRVDGIDIYYDKKSVGHHGGYANTCLVNLDEGENIIAAYGKCGDSMDQLFFRTSTGRDFGGGGTGGSSWSALPPAGVNAYLAYISGIQGSDSLESLTFHWVYYKQY